MFVRDVLFIIASAALAMADAPRGHPLFFGSFEDVGQPRVEYDVLPVAEADSTLTDWMRGCPADAFILINDANPFDLGGFKRLQRLAEQSLTRGSFLTDAILDTHDMALDLEDYCHADLIKVDTLAPEDIASYIDTKPRVFYVDFDTDADAERKDLVLRNVLRAIPSPFVTVVYASTVPQGQPLFRSVQLSPSRLTWQRQRQRHDAEKIAPIIAPLFQRDDVGHTAPELAVDLPDHFFLTLLVASVFVALFMAYNDWSKTRRRIPNRKDT